MRLAHKKAEVLFYLGLAFLFTHELDAMPNHEWRVLPLTSFLSDSVGQKVFVLAHIPIFAIVIACVASLNKTTRSTAQNFVGGFFIIHAGLHFLFSGHKDYEFDSWLSSTLIYGAALLGLAFFVLKRSEQTSST